LAAKQGEKQMFNYTSTMQTYYFKVLHPETNELKTVRIPAATRALATKVLIMQCGTVILDRIVQVHVGDKVLA
jgi:hypothetical protein